MHVLVSLVVVGERVHLDLHYLQWDALHFFRCGPATRGLLHVIAMCKLRPLLHTLSRVRVVQSFLEKDARRQAMMPGHPKRVFKKVVDPVVYHDASTMYMGVLGASMGWGSSRTMRVTCERCGKDDWGYSCTPPVLTKFGLRRDHLDRPEAFCWGCVARSGAATKKYREQCWPDCFTLCFLYDDWHFDPEFGG